MDIEKILEKHVLWLNIDSKGERACFAYESLVGVNLKKANLEAAYFSRANLQYANMEFAILEYADFLEADLGEAKLKFSDLENANLKYAELICADLEYANLFGADLRGANLIDAKLKGASLQCAKLEGAKLPDGFYQFVTGGCLGYCITYDSINDQIICGRWNDYTGNHLDSFVKYIEKMYGKDGMTPIEKYYKQYMKAVKFFIEMKGIEY